MYACSRCEWPGAASGHLLFRVALSLDDFEIAIAFNGYVQRCVGMHRGALTLADQDPIFCRKLGRQLSAGPNCQAYRGTALLAVNVKRLFGRRIHPPKIWAGEVTSNSRPSLTLPATRQLFTRFIGQKVHTLASAQALLFPSLTLLVGSRDECKATLSAHCFARCR